VTLFDEIAGTALAAHAERDEVRAHILRICELQRGTHLVAPDYGIDDPTYLFHSFPGGLDQWLRHLERTISRFEPRLRDVRIAAEVGTNVDFTVSIDIRGTLAFAGRVEGARFNASVDAAQRWSMR
jgi:type VI secretion system lysozyme-like protein